MGPKEGSKGADLVPPCEHLRLRVAKEASHVRSRETQAPETIREHHLDTGAHHLPGTHVVSSPHGAKTLRAREEGASEDEGTLRRIGADGEGLPGGVGLEGLLERERMGREQTYIEHAIDIMHISVLPTTVVDVVLLHGDFRAVEDRGLARL